MATSDRHAQDVRKRYSQCAVWRYGDTPPRQSGCRHGYTVVELMVTVLIVTVLATAAGAFFVKLLNIQEREREEAYVREKLSDICGAYADMLSVGSSIIASNNPSNQVSIVKYRQETGGVSLETGHVTHVAYLTSSMDATNNVMDFNVLSLNPEEDNLDKKFLIKLTRHASGDAALIPLPGDMVSCTLMPLGTTGGGPVAEEMSEEDDYVSRWKAQKEGYGFEMTDAALGRLEVKALYKKGEYVLKTVTVERVVRLWNKE